MNQTNLMEFKKEVFNDEKIKHIFCEWEQFPAAVLKQHWPEGIYYGDIADLVADTTGKGQQNTRNNSEGRHALRSEAHENKEQGLTILTGGFPCQPFSQAGRRRGTADDRYRWPNMFRVIQNVRPDWVIAENVRGLVTWNEGMVLEQICTDLESEGYEVQPFIIPAVAVNAPHRRDRVWIIANTRCQYGEQGFSDQRQESESQWPPQATQVKRLKYPDWNRDWRQVAFATCHDGLDDGLPRELDGATTRGKRTNQISPAKWRRESLKSYGNAIVPQVVMQIFKAIKQTNNGETL